MQLADFRYDLPGELIARYPLEKRTDSRLLCLDGGSGTVVDRRFNDLEALLEPGDLLVFNDTRVMPARLYGHKETGGEVEILIERILAPRRALVHMRSSKTPRTGATVCVGDACLLVLGRKANLFEISVTGINFVELMARNGHVPLPPYIDRLDNDLDKDRYQTVYAKRLGAVAAPTAGLHFDQPTLSRLTLKGVGMARLTLHVGAGTFQPVRTQRLENHVMHSEYLEVNEVLVDQVRETKDRGGRVVAVGTTSVRSLETACAGDEIRPYTGETQLFIRPGYRFKMVDALLTNFHLPESTLLMLVCAFAGYRPVMDAYRHAVAERYRFFSYGDAMFLTRRTSFSAK